MPDIKLISKLHPKKPDYIPPDWVWFREALHLLGQALSGKEWNETDMDAVSSDDVDKLRRSIKAHYEFFSKLPSQTTVETPILETPSQ